MNVEMFKKTAFSYDDVRNINDAEILINIACEKLERMIMSYAKRFEDVDLETELEAISINNDIRDCYRSMHHCMKDLQSIRNAHTLHDMF